jgi:uncharacterized protein (TIGR02145 family)
MDILDTQRFNEKLNIQPISKERLGRGVYGFGVVKLGGLLWTSENANIEIGTDGNPLEYNVDYKRDYGTYYYTYEGAMKIVPKGWRLPTSTDFLKLLDFGSDIIAKGDGGSDKYGFGAKMLGCMTDRVHQRFQVAWFFCSNPPTASGYRTACRILRGSDIPLSIQFSSPETKLTIRFCKDI